MGLIGFTCPKHGYINCEETGKRICPHCTPAESKRADNYNVQFKMFKPFFCTGTGSVIESEKQRETIAKKNGWLFGDDKDFVSDAAKNKKETRKRVKEKFRKGLKEKLMKVV